MAQQKDKSWFNDIVLPVGKGSLGDGLGYLDRMIGGSNPSQRQFMSMGKKAQGPRNNSANKKNNTLPDRKFCDKRPLESKPIDVNVDDETWIADRKKKFPKIKSPSHNDDSDIPLDRVIRCPSPKDDSKEPIQDIKPCKTNNKANGSGPPKRKMTLFEKLTQMDEQST